MDMTNELIDFVAMLIFLVSGLCIACAACAIQNWFHSRYPTPRSDLDYIARQRSKAMRRRARRRYGTR